MRVDGVYIADAALSLAGRCSRSMAPVIASALIRRDAIVRAGGYPVDDYLEDGELIERVRLVGRGLVATMPGRWYVIRRHASNVTLSAGERGEAYTAFALADVSDVREASQAIEALRRGPGGGDVRGGA